MALGMSDLMFTIPVALSVTWFLLSSFMGMDGDGDGDGGMDAEADGDFEAGQAVHGLLAEALSFVGFGRIPTVLWLQMAGMSWGVTGLAARASGLGPWASASVALCLTMIAVPVLSGLLSRIVPQGDESDAVDPRALMGARGRIVSTKADGSWGQAMFQRADGKPLVWMSVRTEDGSVLPEGRDVVVVDVDVEQGIAIVLDHAGLDRSVRAMVSDSVPAKDSGGCEADPAAMRARTGGSGR